MSKPGLQPEPAGAVPDGTFKSIFLRSFSKLLRLVKEDGVTCVNLIDDDI